MGRVADKAGIDIERRMHPIRVQHSQSLVCVGIAIVKLNGHNCLYYSRGLRVIEHQEQAPGNEGCHKDHACVPGYATSNLCLHLVLPFKTYKHLLNSAWGWSTKSFDFYDTAPSCSTPHSKSVWRGPRNEPLVEVDRAVLVTVHHQATVLMLATIRPLPQWHVLLVLAGMAHLGRIALVYYRKCFPKAQTLVFEHLHKAVESPVII